jgi:hypothetical protein
MQTIKGKIKNTAYKNILSAIQKLSPEEKQLLRLELFSADAINDMKSLEESLKKSKKPVRKTNTEIVNLTTSIRRTKYANSKKMLH